MGEYAAHAALEYVVPNEGVVLGWNTPVAAAMDSTRGTWLCLDIRMAKHSPTVTTSVRVRL